ncbi:MAG: hypothetical protein AAF441_21710 [Pseudomonadota bacterium]
MAEDEGFIDGNGARAVAGVVAIGAAALLVWLNWHVLVPPPPKEQDDAGLNPEFVACRDQRLTTVTKMKQDGVINDQQFGQFRERAIATCAGQFPPGGDTQ